MERDTNPMSETKVECRRCSECPDGPHHWMPNGDFGDGDDPRRPETADYAFICKHCPAVAGECPDCQGEGAATFVRGDEDVEADCPRCAGWGVIEGLAFTEWRVAEPQP